MAAQDTPSTGDVTVVRIPGPRAVQTGVPAFHAQLAPFLDQPVPRIVLDMGDVEFVDSAYLGAMVMDLKRAVSRQGDLKLCCLHKQVEKLFHKLRLSRVFDVHETEEGARNAFSSPRPSS
jgi:anti-sigma B factor antagonist